MYKEIGAVHSTKHAKCIITFIMRTKCRVRDFKAGALRNNFKWFVNLNVISLLFDKLRTDSPQLFFRYASSLRDLE